MAFPGYILCRPFLSYYCSQHTSLL